VFNVACNERHSLLDIVAVLERLIGHALPRRHVGPRRGDVRHTQASIEHINSKLGFRPSVGFEDGLRRTWEWFSEAARSAERRGSAYRRRAALSARTTISLARFPTGNHRFRTTLNAER